MGRLGSLPTEGGHVRDEAGAAGWKHAEIARLVAAEPGLTGGLWALGLVTSVPAGGLTSPTTAMSMPAAGTRYRSTIGFMITSAVGTGTSDFESDQWSGCSVRSASVRRARLASTWVSVDRMASMATMYDE